MSLKLPKAGRPCMKEGRSAGVETDWPFAENFIHFPEAFKVPLCLLTFDRDLDTRAGGGGGQGCGYRMVRETLLPRLSGALLWVRWTSRSQFATSALRAHQQVPLQHCAMRPSLLVRGGVFLLRTGGGGLDGCGDSSCHQVWCDMMERRPGYHF